MSRREKKQIKLPSWDLRFLQGFVVLKSNQNYIFVNLSQEKKQRQRERERRKRGDEDIHGVYSRHPKL